MSFVDLGKVERGSAAIVDSPLVIRCTVTAEIEEALIIECGRMARSGRGGRGGCHLWDRLKRYAGPVVSAARHSVILAWIRLLKPAFWLQSRTLRYIHRIA